MKVEFLKSACVLVEASGVKILTDPWLVDGEYFGAWAHYPPYDFDPGRFADVDFIYISHIHPDHCSRKTLALLPRCVPVLVHAYASGFLRANLEALGFRVFELPHNQPTELKNGVSINILAADNCDPALCGRFFGCPSGEKTLGSAQIDSLSVIDDGRHVALNVNDCPFDLAQASLALVKQMYTNIDLLLTGYSGAGPYPQCFPQLSPAERDRAAAAKKHQFLHQGERFITAIEPRFYMPFAGTYTLSGKLARLNSHRGVPGLEEACKFFQRPESHIDCDRSRCIALSSGGTIDLASGECHLPHFPIGRRAKERYLAEVLAPRPLDYEAFPRPSIDELLALVPKAWERMERKRRQLGLETPTRVLVDLGNGTLARLSLAGDGFGFVTADVLRAEERFVLFRTDPRLLLWLLKGPRYAHWDNAEIGSHIEFERRPDVYERGLYRVMCSFHA